MKIDGKKIDADALRSFLVALPKTVPFAKKQGLALYDAMVIHGLIAGFQNRRTFVEAVNNFAGETILHYEDCKRFDDPEFHKPTKEWSLERVSDGYFKKGDNTTKRRVIVRGIEAELQKLIK